LGDELQGPFSSRSAATATATTHQADTTLAELNASLLREEEGLVSKRGLVTTYAGGGGVMGGGDQLNDNQTFTLHVTEVGAGLLLGGGLGLGLRAVDGAVCCITSSLSEEGGLSLSPHDAQTNRS